MARIIYTKTIDGRDISSEVFRGRERGVVVGGGGGGGVETTISRRSWPIHTVFPETEEAIMLMSRFRVVIVVGGARKMGKKGGGCRRGQRGDDRECMAKYRYLVVSSTL